MTSIATRPDTPRAATRPGWFRYERVLRRCVLAALVVLVILYAGELHRRASFWATGAVQVDGLTFHLNPDDEFLTQCVLDHGSWEPEETRLVCERLKPGDTVVDVGANIGWYTLFASRAVGRDGLVIAFEPDPTNFALLKRNIEANGCRNVRLEQKALSNKGGSVTLFRHESNQGMHSLLWLDEGENSIEVEAVRLDDYFRDHSRRVNLVKIDVEGAEGMVLEGMCETLARNPHMSLFLEFAPSRLAASGYDPSSLLGELARTGFDIYDIEQPPSQRRVTGVSDLIARLDRERLIFTDLLLCGHRTSVNSESPSTVTD